MSAAQLAMDMAQLAWVCMHVVNLHLSWQFAVHFNTASD